ncbi:MAG: Uma2 family endonuclease [Thermoanaerobaculia bacterium]
MTERAKHGASYDDVLAAPDDKIAEVVSGDLYLSPRPAIPHARVLSALGADLHDAFDRGRTGPGGWWILHEPELHLFGDVLVPDLAGWRHSTLPELPDAPAFTIRPDWVCEVLSPSTAQFDRTQKAPRYALAEVGYLWLVDLVAHRLEVYARSGSDWIRLESHAGDAIVSAAPFEAAAIALERIWA